MRRQLSRRHFAPFLAAPFFVACGAASKQAASDLVATTAPAPVPTTVPPALATPVAVAPAAPAPAIQPASNAAGPLTFKVRQNDSKATFRVREQLAGRQLPNDAVGSTTGVTGQLALGA